MPEENVLSPAEISEIDAVTGGVQPAPVLEVESAQLSEAVEPPAEGETPAEEQRKEEPQKSRYDEQIAERTAKLIEADNRVRRQQRDVDAARKDLEPVIKLANMAKQAMEAGDPMLALQALFPDSDRGELALKILERVEGPKALGPADIEALVEKKLQERLSKSETERQEKERLAYEQSADAYVEVVADAYHADRKKYPTINKHFELHSSEITKYVQSMYRATGKVPSPEELLSRVNADRVASLTEAGFHIPGQTQPRPIAGTTGQALISSDGGTNGRQIRRSHYDEMEEWIKELDSKFSS